MAIFVLSQGEPPANNTSRGSGGSRPRSPGPFSVGSNKSKSPKGSTRSPGGGSRDPRGAEPRAPYAESWMSRLKCDLLLLEGQMLSHTGRLADAEKRLTRLHRELSHAGRSESITACSAYTTIAEM